MKTHLPAALLVFFLGGVCGAIIHSWQQPPRAGLSSQQQVQATDELAPPSARRSQAPQPTRVIQDIKPFAWSQLESSDYKQYIANLRAIGCPEKTIRDLVRSELDQHFRTRHESADRGPSAAWNYWEPRTDQGPGAHYERERTHRELEREKERLLRELLGEPGAPPPNDAALARAEGLDPKEWSRETRERIHEIQQKYHLLEDEIHHSARGEIYPEDAVRIAELRRQCLDELGSILTPEQLHEYQLRESHTAERLRHQLVAFQPTEEEYRLIFDIQRLVDQELGLTEFHFESPEFRRQREQAEQILKEKLRGALGEERFADYELASDHRYSDLYRLGERFDLPDENVRGMFDLWRQSEQQADRIRSNDAISEADRLQALNQLRQQVESEGMAYLGQEGFFNYRNRGGEWMQRLFDHH